MLKNRNLLSRINFATHLPLIAIICLATWLRIWQLNTHGILFGDAAHDLLSAVQAVEERSIPLLGIASSVPRFKQGPLTVWLEMGLNVLAGKNYFFYQLTFAALGIAAVIAVYEFSVLYLSKRVALWASLLVAASPLAIAHSRMVYHTTAIPLMTILFLFLLMRWRLGKNWGAFGATLGWALLFQFELAVFPLFLLLPYVIWRDKHKLTKNLFLQIAAGLLIGLLPQILFDLQNRGAQLLSFVAWVGYRIAGLFWPGGEHVASIDRLQLTLNSFWLFGGRIFSFDQSLLKVIAFALLAVALVVFSRAIIKRRSTPATELITLATLLLIVGYSVHGTPSEAYYPPFFVLWPLLIASLCDLVASIKPTLRTFITWGLVLWAVVNTRELARHNFFVSTQKAFAYGPSILEQRQALEVIHLQSGTMYTLRSTQPGTIFPSYFDNFRWVAHVSSQTPPSEGGTLYFIEPLHSELLGYPGATIVKLQSLAVIHVPDLEPAHAIN